MTSCLISVLKSISFNNFHDCTSFKASYDYILWLQLAIVPPAPPILHSKSFNTENYLKTFQPNSFMHAILAGTMCVCKRHEYMLKNAKDWLLVIVNVWILVSGEVGPWELSSWPEQPIQPSSGIGWQCRSDRGVGCGAGNQSHWFLWWDQTCTGCVLYYFFSKWYVAKVHNSVSQQWQFGSPHQWDFVVCDCFATHR